MKRSTKKPSTALTAGLLSLLLCVVFMAGTTFAWFTDSIFNNKNKILAGNLDVDLEYSKDLVTWKPVEGDENLFATALWEPGAAEYIYFRVSNAGTLALKYQLTVYVDSETAGTNVDNEPFRLSDVLKQGTVKDPTSVFADRAAAIAAVKDSATPLSTPYVKQGTELLSGKNDILAMVIYMPSDVGNAANYLTGTEPPSITLGIRLEATQVENEEDGFNSPEYDKEATFAGVISVNELLAELAAGKDVSLLVNTSIATLADRPVMNGGSLNGNGNTITYTGDKLPSMSAPVLTTKGGTIANLKIDGGANGRALYVDSTLAGDLYVQDCVLSGAYAFNYNSAVKTDYTLNFTRTTFKSWTSYANSVAAVYFSDCVFEANLRPYASTILTRCNFTATATLDLSELEAGESITLIDCTLNGSKITDEAIKAWNTDVTNVSYDVRPDGTVTITAES